MPNLLDAILAFFDQSKTLTDEQKAANAIEALKIANTDVALASIVAILPQAVVVLPTVRAAILAKQGIVTKEGAGGPYADVAKGLVDGFQAIEPEIETAALQVLNPVFRTSAKTVPELFATVSGAAVRDVVCAGLNTGNADQKKIADEIAAILGPVVLAGVTFTVASLIADQMHPVKNPGLQTAMRTLQDIVGYESLTRAYSDPIREATISVPTRYRVMRLLQPWAVRPQEAAVLVQKRLMTPAQYGDILRYTGIQEQYVPALQSDVWREMSMRDLQRIFDTGRPDPAWTREKVQKMGHNDEDVDKILPTLYQRALTAEIGSIKALQRSQYKDGVLTKNEYAAKLAARGITVAESKEFLDAVDAEIEYDQNKDLQAGFELKFLNGRSTEAELRAALGTLKMQPEKIDARIKYLVVKKLGKLTAAETEKTLSRADIVKLYAAGKLTKQAAAKRLDDMGWSADDAMSVTDLEDLDALDAVRAENIRTAEEKARNLRLPIADLDDVYVAQGKSQAWATARAAYVEQQVLGKVAVAKPVNPDEERDAVRAENIRAAEQEAKYGRLSKKDLITVYTANGKTSAWATARAEYIGELVLGKEKTE